MSALHKKSIVVLLLLIGGGVAWYFWPVHHTRSSAPENRKPVAVKSVKVQLLDAQSFNEFAGTVQSSVTVQISARIVAHLQEIPVHSGTFVKKGELLLRLDDGDIRARMKQAQSQLTAAEATRDEAQKDMLRYQDLVKSNIEPRQRLEQAESRAKNAAAAVETARQQLAEANETLGYTEIKAPFDAVVVEKFAQQGDLAAPGRILLTLQDPTRLRLETPVSEQCAKRIHVGDSVLAKVASADTQIQTRVTEIVPTVDPKSRSFLVRANLPVGNDLKPGMFGRLYFPCAPRKMLTVPQTAVIQRGQLDLIFVIADGVAKLHLIRLGQEQSGKVEILSGLMANEIVVTVPPESLRDGDLVTTTPEERS